MESGLNKNQIISVLTKSPHGDLAAYAPIGLQAAREDPEFFAHLIAWNDSRGAIRDAKVALPVLALTSLDTVVDHEIRDNALAHIMRLDPRNLVRAVRFAKGQPVKQRRLLARTVERYLREREANRGKFERVALQHKGSLKELYALLHIKPGNDHVRAALGLSTEQPGKHLKGGALREGNGHALPKTGVFAEVARLKDMAPAEAAAFIVGKRIPFLVAQGALGAKAKDPDVVRALIEAMSPTEVVTNSKMLDKLGVKTNPVLRATYEKALTRATESKTATLKTTRAADAIGGKTGEKLRGVQEKQLDKIAVQGDWLVLADKSGSMQAAIETARHVAGVLARVAAGNVHLVFFDTAPTYYDVTGMDYDKIVALTRRVMAGGGTGIGCGLVYIMEKSLEVDGIAIVSDGGENHAPAFREAHAKYAEKFGKDVPVYFYKVKGRDPDHLTGNCQRNGLDIHTFDLTDGLDYYSLPNLVQTMRTNRYGLLDEINNTPLLRLEDVFKEAA